MGWATGLQLDNSVKLGPRSSDVGVTPHVKLQ